MTQWTCNGIKFESGDKVRVARDIPSLDPDGMGEGKAWENTWIHRLEDDSQNIVTMSDYLGLEFVIEHIDDEGVHFAGGGDSSYAFPLAALDMVEAFSPN